MEDEVMDFDDPGIDAIDLDDISQQEQGGGGSEDDEITIQQQDFEPFDFPQQIQRQPQKQQQQQQQQQQQRRFIAHEAFATLSTTTPNQMGDENARQLGNRSQMMPVGNEPLRSVDEVGPKFACVFPSFKQFNAVQSRCFDAVFHSDRNVVLSAPTASGKLGVLELAICRMISKVGLTGKRAIYLSPTKALCQQVFETWKPRFQQIDVTCVELTGDTEINDLPSDFISGCISSAGLVVITTPEKWDAYTSHWKAHIDFLKNLSLVLIDEVHLLGTDRGATLEAVVCRMKTMCYTSSASSSPTLRFIAVSATIPNINDVAAWIGASKESTFALNEEYRPVKVNIHVLGYPKAKNDFLFDRNLTFKLCDVISMYAERKPSLIFCSSRKGATMSAQQIAKDCNTRFLIKSKEHAVLLNESANKIEDKSLADCIRKGVGFHSAGMSHSDRSIVEQLFLNDSLLVLCTTTTLSMGVNFPAHLVVIKSTQQYRIGKGYVDLEENDVRQMIGRAGRPQFDNSATACILTTSEMQSKWKAVLSSGEPLESSLLSQLKEHLVSEICLGTITSSQSALVWLTSTFLWQRVQVNPAHYSIPCGLSQEKLSEELRLICLKDLQELANAKLIVFSSNSSAVQPTELGRTQSRFYVAFDTMKLFAQEIVPNSSLETLLNVLCKAKEFSDIHLRKDEKRTLNEMNKSKPEVIRFPFKERITKDEQKISLLIQASLSGCESTIFKDNWGLRQDSQAIFRCIGRLCSCMIKYIQETELHKFYGPFFHSLILRKVIDQNIWENSSLVLRQLDHIGINLATNLASAGIKSFDDLRNEDPRRLEMVCNRRPPFGNVIKETLMKTIPKLALELKRIENTSSLEIDALVIYGGNNKKLSTCHLIITNSLNEILLHKVMVCNVSIGNPRCSLHELIKQVNFGTNILGILINEHFIGCDVYKRINSSSSSSSSSSATQISIPSEIASQTTTTTTTKSKAEENTENEENDDDDLEPTFSIGPIKTTVTRNLPTSLNVAESSKRKCNHNCRNKFNCGHPCCKGSNVNNQLVQPKTTPMKKRIHTNKPNEDLQQQQQIPQKIAKTKENEPPQPQHPIIQIATTSEKGEQKQHENFESTFIGLFGED